MINTEYDLLQFCEGLKQDLSTANSDELFLTVDTEFIRDSSTEPLLCSIQIASEHRADIVDTLTIKDISVLADLMNDEKILKVFHGCDQDIDILVKNNIGVRNAYDTQLAELAISSDKVASYETLVLKHLKHNLKKIYKISDWKKRPLSAEQEKYALDDVTYLRGIFKRQSEILSELQRSEWVKEVMSDKMALYSSTLDSDVLSTFSKNVSELNEESLSILKELATWRMKIAVNENKPDHLVVKNDMLLSVAKGGMNRIKQISKSRFYKDKKIKEFVSIATKVCKGHKIGHYVPTKDNSSLADFLKIVLDYCSYKFNINKSFIADHDDIYGIANDVGSICQKFQRGWRYDVFGKYIQPSKEGKISISIYNSTLRIVENE